MNQFRVSGHTLSSLLDFLRSASIYTCFVSSKQAFFKELLDVQQCTEKVLCSIAHIN